MPNSTRDPRVDPKPGDVLKRGRIKRSVEYLSSIRENGPMGVAWPTNRGKYTQWETLEYWRKWAKGAEVINAAE